MRCTRSGPKIAYLLVYHAMIRNIMTSTMIVYESILTLKEQDQVV